MGAQLVVLVMLEAKKNDLHFMDSEFWVVFCIQNMSSVIDCFIAWPLKIGLDGSVALAIPGR